MIREVAVEGTGLHGGQSVRVVLRARPGPVAMIAASHELPVHDLVVVSTVRATTVETHGTRIATVEHLFAACAAMGIHEGLAIEIHGPELPLLDGGAGVWCDALATLEIAPSPATLRILRDETILVGESRYAFTHQGSRIQASIDFGDARLARDASWEGSPADFRVRIASARTFAFAHEIDDLARAHLASRVTPESVILIAPDAILSHGAAFSADEPARHKLLDLVGDLFLYGGPPEGSVYATRPGHTATHAAMRMAFERGIVDRR